MNKIILPCPNNSPKELLSKREINYEGKRCEHCGACLRFDGTGCHGFIVKDNPNVCDPD